MAVACSVCRHPAAGSIDADLRSGSTARAVAAAFDLSYDALTRHARNHLPRRAQDDRVADRPGGDPLDELVVALRGRALAGDAAVVREYRLALAAVSTRQSDSAPVVPFVATAEWAALRSRILAALEAYPAARLAVADALAEP